MLEKGDKVRFMDEALEGTVTALIGKDRAEVLTSDGFSRIAFLTQLVKVRTGKEEQNMTKPSPVAAAAPPVAPAVKHKKGKGKLFAFDEHDLKEEIIYAGFELIDVSSPMTSAVQLHVINNTGLAIAFSLSRKFDMRDEGIAMDKMEPRSLKSFLTYTQEELKLFEAFRLQVLFYPMGKSAFRPPVQKQFRFNLDDLLESQDFIFGKSDALLVQLFDLKQAPEVDITPLVNKFSDAVKEEDSVNTKKMKSGKSSKTIVLASEKIVDLHIEELIKDFTAMSNGQIISHQLKHFQYEMDQAIINHLHKITFIHGVGTGTLRSAIREELKKYAGITFGNAPAEKFGYGATEIVFS